VPPPKLVLNEEMLLELTAKLPLPVMFAAVGAWPISSAWAGPAIATAAPVIASVNATVDSVRATRPPRGVGRR